MDTSLTPQSGPQPTVAEQLARIELRLAQIDHHILAATRWTQIREAIRLVLLLVTIALSIYAAIMLTRAWNEWRAHPLGTNSGLEDLQAKLKAQFDHLGQ